MTYFPDYLIWNLSANFIPTQLFNWRIFNRLGRMPEVEVAETNYNVFKFV